MSIFKTYKTFNEISTEFLIEKEISVKNKTYSGYIGKIKIFNNWLKSNNLYNIPLRKLTNDNINKFFIYIAKDKDLDKPTCQKYFYNIKSIFVYAQKRKELDILPFDLIIFPNKKRDNRPQYIPKDKQVELLNDIHSNDLQLFVACMLQYFCALRPGKELRLIKVGDFDFVNSTVRVSELNSKTGRLRYVTLSNEMIQYCKEYNINTSNPELYVFGNKKIIGDKPISINMLRYRFNKFRDKHNITKKVKFYSFKHTGGTDLINSKLVSLVQLQNHFGHTRISSTEKYVKDHGGMINLEIKEKFISPLSNILISI